MLDGIVLSPSSKDDASFPYNDEATSTKSKDSANNNESPQSKGSTTFNKSPQRKDIITIKTTQTDTEMKELFTVKKRQMEAEMREFFENLSEEEKKGNRVAFIKTTYEGAE